MGGPASSTGMMMSPGPAAEHHHPYGGQGAVPAAQTAAHMTNNSAAAVGQRPSFQPPGLLISSSEVGASSLLSAASTCATAGTTPRDDHVVTNNHHRIPVEPSKMDMDEGDGPSFGGEDDSRAAAAVSEDDEDMVPTVFRWEHGGRQVFVTGTFNNWEKQIPMHRSGNDFTYIHNLKKGKHAFRFVVDDEWRFAPDQQTVADIEGRINNFIDVSDFDAYTGDENFILRRGKSISSDLYTRLIPDLDEYTKDPPPLPPHLRHIILNKVPPVNDPNTLPTPQHVALNHLYCTAIKDGTMVLGVTVRYRHTACTTVYYSCS